MIMMKQYRLLQSLCLLTVIINCYLPAGLTFFIVIINHYNYILIVNHELTVSFRQLGVLLAQGLAACAV